ncbi:hypothetical protein [Pedobacter nototheniae]|uniref:hypothetical protein n=1 Tax=Pedobacter nototheniae TaxID=2488994 RepID=UPI00292D5BF1|nr:hypothetical protein [Pedobacter nototheniae]
MDSIGLTENNQIKIDYEPALIRVYSNAALWGFLQDHKSIRFEMLAKTIKENYEKEFNKALNITDDSLIVEILVHIYCDYIGLIVHKAIKIKCIQALIRKLIKRAEVVDCGEKQVDSNRWLWDFLARYKGTFIKILPDNLNAKKLKKY